MGTKVVTTEGRVAFPSLFKPSADPSGRENYALTLVFENEAALKPLKDAATILLREKFKDGKVPPRFQFPWRPNSEYSDKEGFENESGFFVRFSKKAEYGAPPVVDTDRLPVTDQGQVYPGCWGKAAVEPYVWRHEASKKQGISFGLVAFQKTRDDTPVAGRGPVDVDELFAGTELETVLN